MNDDAERWIEIYASMQEPGFPVDTEAMCEAMRWAYADAARTVREQQIGSFTDEYQSLDADEPLAKLIEARAK